MLPGAHQGKSDESELFNSLKAHLNNKNRLQPFIGLSSIIECVNGGAPQRNAFFICEVCVCRLDMADMRNHIMGSLHRYNYIKTRQPELVSELGEDSCLSKLAWPLMDIAKKIEGKEGPGNVQVVEFDKTSYQQMESQTNAENVIDFLRDTLKETESQISETITAKICEQTKSPLQRIVLYSPLKKSLQNLAQHSNVSQSLPKSLVDSSFLNDYGEQTPLIGLVRVIECKSEDGQTHCFLCHCCRVRSHKSDIISHLTSASHITNYLMETHPEQLDTLDLNDSSQVELLAENLNKEEGAYKLKVVQIPEVLCIQMAGKSYHWCVKTLGWNNSDFPLKCIAVKRQNVTKFSHQKVSMKADQFPQGKKRKRKTIKQNKPVFKVTLPITQGSLLVERTSFSNDNLPLSVRLSPTDHVGPSPLSDSRFSPDPLDFTLDSSSEIFDSTSENNDLSLQYQLNSPTDYPEQANDPIKQELDEQWTDSFEDQNVKKINIDSNAEYVQKIYAPKPFNAQTSTLSHSEYLPHSFPWLVGTQEIAPPYYQQPPQYMAPGSFPQQNMFSLGQVQGGCRVGPQKPHAGNSFSHNNSITLPHGSHSYSSYYTEHGGNSHQYASYQVSSSGWGTYQSQSNEMTQCYGPCCVPHYPGVPFPNSDAEMTSSNAIYYPVSNFYSSHRSPY
ncbi:hypothetical protein NL108_008743 [Boleophthalmus pectinirostris]|uniref:uncharacterized protein LOC110167469 isoform X2 n=1 Tax=Boleophthalmus pectinirostris TaxID=150288 RepID=UPI000A1C34F4|nr:uncharacterized protein LOC110167469 isoform X2 [Boleophthalmus pectinirostris]KAJ0055018.1 hypothetical protein NL108_008743 [Boleophthalmus pectinirostris]